MVTVIKACGQEKIVETRKKWLPPNLITTNLQLNMLRVWSEQLISQTEEFDGLCAQKNSNDNIRLKRFWAKYASRSS